MNIYGLLKLTQHTRVYVVLSLLVMWLLASCAVEEAHAPAPVNPSGKEVAMLVRIPGNSLPYTRSIAGSGGEAKIKTIDILIFDDAAMPVLIEHATGSAVAQSDDEQEKYKVTFNAALQSGNGSRTIVIIANASETVNSVIYENGSLKLIDKNEALSALIFSSPGTDPDDFRWNAASSSNYTPIPMYGEIKVSKITGSISETVNLTRMLARIDVRNNSAIQFDLKEVYLVNYNTAGYIAPAWNSATGEPLSTLPTDPLMPADPGKQEGESMKIVYTYYDNSSNGLTGEIYAYEASKASATDDTKRKKAACLIVRGRLLSDNKEYYYRMDFTDGKDGNGNLVGDTGFDPSTVEYFPLYRNHKYMFVISSVDGVGYDSFGEALASISVLSNMKSRLLVVDESEITDIVYNGQYYLGTQNLETLGYPGGAVLMKVVTDYPEGWSLNTEIFSDGIEYLSGGGWITGLNQSGQNELLFNVSARQQTDGSDVRSANIHLKAGRLRHTIAVSQTPYLGSGSSFAFSNVVFKDGVLTFAEASGNRGIPSNAQGLYFRYGSLVALSSSGTAFSVIYSPSEYQGDLTNWTGIPYFQSNFQDLDHSRDEFKELYPRKGYDETTGTGDLCRYISDRGWVSGHWRLPTIAEYEALYSVTTGRTDGYRGIRVGSFPYYGETITDPYGLHPIQSGWFQGEGAQYATSSNISSPPANSLFLPGSGERDYQTGNLVTPGYMGYYWSSTPNNIPNGYHILYSKDGITRAAGLNRMYGFSVRCMCDEDPLFWIDAEGFRDGLPGSTYTGTIKANGTWTAMITSGAEHISSYTHAGSANANGTPFSYTFTPSGTGSVTFSFKVASGETTTVTVRKIGQN